MDEKKTVGLCPPSDYGVEMKQRIEREQKKDGVLGPADLTKLAYKMMANDDIEYICDGDERLLCKHCPVDLASDEEGECTDKLRKEWAREYLKRRAPTQAEKEKPMFEPKTRGGHEYVIYKIYHYTIHGAVYSEGDWHIISWHIDGMRNLVTESSYDLIFLKPKKRRFKTAEELIADKNTEVRFLGEGSILVTRGIGASSEVWRRYAGDKLEQNHSYDELWLNVFTVLE